MTTNSNRSRLRSKLIPGLLILAVAGLGCGVANNQDRDFASLPDLEGLEFAKKSAYSHIQVVTRKNLRSLFFVSDKGEKMEQSILDLQSPHEMVFEYTKMMFLSYLLRPRQEKVLIVGLGGGSMVHFLKHYDPAVKMDVLEIDPVVVKVADDYFGVRSGGNVNIIVKDGFEFFKSAESKYDVIYMDAFLKPSADADGAGVPLRLKTKQFYKEMQRRLTPDGLVVFNIYPYDGVNEDLKTITESFQQAYPFELTWGGLVVVASMAPGRVDRMTLVTRGGELDRRFQTSFSFRELAGKLRKS